MIKAQFSGINREWSLLVSEDVGCIIYLIIIKTKPTITIIAFFY